MCAITGNVETYNPATHRVEQRAATEFAADPVKVESRQLDDILSNLARTNAEVSVLGSIPEHAKPAWLKVFERDPEYKEKLQAASYMTGLLPQLREAEKDNDLIRAAQLLGSYDAVSRWAESALSGYEADYMERLRRRLDKAGVEIIPSPVNKPFTGDTPELRAASAFHDDALFPGETIIAACTAAGVRRRVIGMDPVVTPAQVTLASHTVRNPELKYDGRTFTPARVTVDREHGTVRIFTYDEPISGDSRELGRELFPDLPDRKVYETEISIRAYDRMLQRAGWKYTFDENSGRRIWMRPEAEKEVTDAIEKESRNPENKPSEPGEPQQPRQSERTEQPVAEVPAEPNRDSQPARETSDISETPAESDIRPAGSQQPQPSQPTSETPQKPAAPPAPIELRPEDSVFIGGQEVPIMFINPDGSVEALSVLPVNEKSVEDNGRYYTTFPSREALENAAEHRPDGSLRVIRDGKELPVAQPERKPGGAEASASGKPVESETDNPTQTQESYNLSKEVNEFGKPFVISSDGSTDFGYIDKESGLTPLPIRLNLGENYKDEKGNNHGYGYLHIEAGHKNEILQNGFSSIEEFVEEVARNYTEIKEGAKIGQNQTYLLEIADKHNNTLFIQLSRNGEYWNVNSAGIFNKRYSRRRPEVFSRPAVGNGTAPDTTEVDSGLEKNSATAPAGNSSKTSDRKVNTNPSQNQTQTEKTAANTSAQSAEPTDPKGLRDGADRAQRDIDALEKLIESHRTKEPSRLSAGTSYEEKHAKWQEKMDELQDQLPPLRELVLRWRKKADQLEEEQRQAEERRVIAEGGIPEDADGNWQFHKVTPEHTYRFLTERQGYTADDVIATADANIDAKEPKKPKLGANAKANAEKLQDYNRRLEEFNRNREYWQQVKEIAVRDKAEAEKAAEAARAEEIRRQEEERRRAEEEAARRGAEKGVGPEIIDRWNGAEKIQGRDDAIITPSGRTIRGRYVLVEEGAATPSHDPETGFAKSPGFPVDKNGNTVNDRDYERDKAAQQYVHRVAAGYDGRAVQDPVIVSRDGVVLSGNNRTMSGRIAARDNTDAGYTGHLEATAPKYGFTAEQVRSMKHPRLYFETEENLPYTAETFALFNKTEKKEMNVTERSVKLGKTISEGVFNRMAREMDAYETFTEYARSPEAVQAIKDLHAAGVIETAELPRYYDEQSGAITPEGVSLLQGALIGHVFSENPDVVRMAMEHPAVRDSILKALVMLAENSRFSPEYSLIGDISRAIEIYHKGKEAGFRTVSESVLQHSLLEAPDIPETTALVIADLLNGGKTTRLQKFLKEYNADARLADAGQLDIFSENAEPTPASEILRQVYETLGINPKQYERYEKLRNNGKPDEPTDPEGPNGSGDNGPEGPGGNRPEPNGPQGGKPEGGGEPPQTPARPGGGAPQPGGGTEPSDAQKRAGNYRKEHRSIDGYRISIENPKGSVRRGTDENGKAWENTMRNDYGYIRGTTGADGDHIDVFLSDSPERGDVFVIDQVKEDGSFDEHKVMYGFSSEQEARQAYLSNYTPGWNGLGDITRVSKGEFKKWINSSRRKGKPFAEYKNVKTLTEEVDQTRTNVDSEGLIVDNEGKPMVFYHGTPNDVEKLEDLEPGHTRRGEDESARFNGDGVSFTPHRDVAEDYANDGHDKGKVFRARIRLKSPYFTVGVANFTPEEAAAFTAELKAKGYDGIINYASLAMRETGAEPNEVIVFDISSAIGTDTAADLRITLRQRDGETSYQISRHDVLEAAGRPRGMFDVAKTASHWHFGGLYDSDGRGSFLFPDRERAEAFLKAAEQYPGDPQAFEKAARELAERRDDGLFHKGEKYTVGEEKTTLEILSPRSLRGDYEVSVEGHKGIFKESQLQKILKPETLPEPPDTETASEPTQGYGNSPLPNFMQAVRALYQKGKKAAAQLFQMSFFDVTKTPEFMKVLGLKGEKFTIRFGVISRHFGKDSDHKLPEDIWEQLPEALQRPFAISKHFEEKNGEKKQKGYRIYTTLKHNDRYVIVGAEVKNIGRNLEINAIETAFAIKKPSESEDFIYTSETITPEQQSLLNGRNSRQYPVAQGLSAGKGTTNSQTGQTNPGNSAETASEPSAGRRQRGPELTPSLFGPEQPRRRAERTPSLFRFKPGEAAKPEARPELTEEQQQSADRANAAIDRYVDAFAEHLERTKNLAEDIPDDISAPFYDARDRALDAIAEHYRALGNTEADARRMARDQLTTVTAEASVRLNRKPATLPAEEGAPYRPAEKTETEADAKAYRTAGGEAIEYSSSDGLPRKEQGEFALVERKFVADGYFGFTGSETVETADDVAYLFRQLENHATEHAFVLLVKDGRPTVVHIGQGSFDATLVNFGVIRAANDALGGADGIYFIHNHPSGNLSASEPDLNIMRTLEKMFPDQVRPGVIIDTTSGRYLQFTGRDISSLETRPTEARGAETAHTVNNFDRQVFSPEYDSGQLRQIRDESDVAAYVSTLRLGTRDKISFLVLDRANKVTGNFHTDFDRYSDHEEMADMMIRQALRFGGTSVIIYGNEKALRPERAVRDAFSAQMKDIFKRKSGNSVRFLDNVSVKNGLDSTGQSASEAAPTYGSGQKRSRKKRGSTQALRAFFNRQRCRKATKRCRNILRFRQISAPRKRKSLRFLKFTLPRQRTADRRIRSALARRTAAGRRAPLHAGGQHHPLIPEIRRLGTPRLARPRSIGA